MLAKPLVLLLVTLSTWGRCVVLKVDGRGWAMLTRKMASWLPSTSYPYVVLDVRTSETKARAGYTEDIFGLLVLINGCTGGGEFA